MSQVMANRPEVTTSLVLHKLDRDYDQALFTSDHNPLTYTLSINEWVMLGRPVNLTVTASSGGRT